MAQDREIVFLLDVSCSMPSALGHGDFEDFTDVIQTARTKAHQLLAPYEGDQHTTVSLYRFGDIVSEAAHGDAASSTWEPHLRAVVERATPTDARAALDDFFTDDPADYADAYTYVAASVFDLAAERLNLRDPCRPVQIGDDQPLITVLALTDVGKQGGGEDAPTCPGHDPRCAFAEANAERLAWLEKNNLENNLSYVHWDIGNDCLDLLAPDEAAYRVRWIDTHAASHNLADLTLAGVPTTVGGLSPRLMLLPDATRPDARYVDAHPELVCLPHVVRPLPDSPAQSAPVKAEMRWLGTDQSTRALRYDGFELALPARHAVEGTEPPRIPLEVLRPTLDGVVELPIPQDAKQAVALGYHGLAFEKQTLCDALTTAYPNSTFLLPPELPQDESRCQAVLEAADATFPIAPIAQVELGDRSVMPVYSFGLHAHGVAPDAPVEIESDWLWRPGPERDRSFNAQSKPPLTPPPHTWTWELRVSRDGRPLGERFDQLVAFADGSTRLTGVSTKDEVVVAFPGHTLRWWHFGTGFPLGRETADYDVEVCSTLEVDSTQPYATRWDCPTCSDALRVDGASACVAIPVHVEGRPLHLFVRILGQLIILALIYLTLAWRWRARYPRDLVIGANERSLRTLHERPAVGSSAQQRFRDFKHAARHRWQHGPVDFLELRESHPPEQATVQQFTRASAAPSVALRPLARDQVQVWVADLQATPLAFSADSEQDDAPSVYRVVVVRPGAADMSLPHLGHTARPDPYDRKLKAQTAVLRLRAGKEAVIELHKGDALVGRWRIQRGVRN